MLELEVNDSQIRKVAKVMDDNGGFAPELSVCQELDEYIMEECILYYQSYFAPNDENFWDEYMIDYGNLIPEAVAEAAELYVTHKVVDVSYYYHADGQDMTGVATCYLRPATFKVMMEVAKKSLPEVADFNSLKEYDSAAYQSVLQEVAAHVVNETAEFKLKEFPYKVLEMVMEDAE